MPELRPYIPSDADMIATWAGDEISFRKWCADRYDRYPITPEDINAWYGKASETGWFFPYTMTEDGIPVGHMIMRYPFEDAAAVRMGLIIVDPSHRGQGFGKQMMELAKKEARERFGANTASLGVFANNEPALRCYLSAGFAEIPAGEKEFFHIFDEDWLCIELECRL